MAAERAAGSPPGATVRLPARCRNRRAEPAPRTPLQPRPPPDIGEHGAILATFQTASLQGLVHEIARQNPGPGHSRTVADPRGGRLRPDPPVRSQRLQGRDPRPGAEQGRPRTGHQGRHRLEPVPLARPGTARHHPGQRADPRTAVRRFAHARALRTGDAAAQPRSADERYHRQWPQPDAQPGRAGSRQLGRRRPAGRSPRTGRRAAESCRAANRTARRGIARTQAAHTGYRQPDRQRCARDLQRRQGRPAIQRRKHRAHDRRDPRGQLDPGEAQRLLRQQSAGDARAHRAARRAAFRQPAQALPVRGHAPVRRGLRRAAAGPDPDLQRPGPAAGRSRRADCRMEQPQVHRQPAAWAGRAEGARPGQGTEDQRRDDRGAVQPARIPPGHRAATAGHGRWQCAEQGRAGQPAERYGQQPGAGRTYPQAR